MQTTSKRWMVFLLIFSLFLSVTMGTLPVQAQSEAQSVDYRTELEIPGGSGVQAYKFLSPCPYIVIYSYSHDASSVDSFSICDAQGISVELERGAEDNTAYAIALTVPGQTYYLTYEYPDGGMLYVDPVRQMISGHPGQWTIVPGATLTKTESDVDMEFSGESNRSWDVWKWKNTYVFEGAYPDGSILANHLFAVIAEYSAYFKNFTVTNNWGGEILDTINDEPDESLGRIFLRQLEKLSFYHEYNALNIDPSFADGVLTVSMDIYVPAGSVLTFDKFGIIRDAASPLPGDMNGDGQRDVADVIQLRKIIMSGDVDMDQMIRGNLSVDHTLNVADLVALRHLIMKGTP